MHPSKRSRRRGGIREGFWNKVRPYNLRDRNLQRGRGVDPEGKKTYTRVFIKMLATNSSKVSIPKPFINELYLMKTVIRDMFTKARSPHFAFPIGQFYGVFPKGDIREVESYLTEHPSRGCEHRPGELGLYNVSEYLDPGMFVSFRDYIRFEDFGDDQLVEFMKMTMVQIMYNLSVMGNMKFRHGDLHLENVLIADLGPGRNNVISYSLDDQSHVETNSRYFVVFIDFDRSSIYTDKYSTLVPSEEEFKKFICIPPSLVESQAPDGLIEACHGWNPHADWTRFVVAVVHTLMRHRGLERMNRVMSSVFGEEIMTDINLIIGDYQSYRFGRVSKRHLEETVDNLVLQRCTPSSLTKRLLNHLSGESWLKTPSREEINHEYPHFKAY